MSLVAAAKMWREDPLTKFSPEIKFLLACASADEDELRLAQIRALSHEVLDWECLLRLSLSHGLMPLVYWNLHRACREEVPARVLDLFEKHFQACARQNLLFTGELYRILTLLETIGIHAIPFKGPTLALWAYGDIALRQFSDLDLLVQPEEILKAKELLLSQGYRPALSLTPAQEKAYLRSPSSAHHQLIHEKSGVLLELHWRVMPNDVPFPINLKLLWRRAEWRTLGGIRALMLSPEDLQLILCVHGSKHLWERLGWITDVARLMRVHPSMDWNEVVRRAESLGARRMLFWGLWLANHLLGVQIPEEIRQKMETEPEIKFLSQGVLKKILCHEKSFFEKFSICLKMRERFRDRLHYCFRTLLNTLTPTSNEWELFPLPDLFFWFYYLLRPVRLMGKWWSKKAILPLP